MKLDRVVESLALIADKQGVTSWAATNGKCVVNVGSAHRLGSSEGSKSYWRFTTGHLTCKPGGMVNASPLWLAETIGREVPDTSGAVSAPSDELGVVVHGAVQAGDLSEAILRVAFAAPRDYARAYAVGIYADDHRENFAAAATDGHRLCIYDKAGLGVHRPEAIAVIAPYSMPSVKTCLKLLGGDCAVMVKEHRLTLIWQDYGAALEVTFADRYFPNYWRILPDVGSMHHVARECLQALPEAVSQAKRDWKFRKAANKKLDVPPQIQFLDANTVQAFDPTCFGPVLVTFDAGYMGDLLKAFGKEPFDLYLSKDSMGMCLAKSVTMSQVVMPMKG